MSSLFYLSIGSEEVLLYFDLAKCYQVKPEFGVIPSGQENHSRAEHLNFPGRELNVIHYRAIFNGRCNLCLEEKMYILLYKWPDKLLNKRSELIARRRHKTKFKL